MHLLGKGGKTASHRQNPGRALLNNLELHEQVDVSLGELVVVWYNIVHSITKNRSQERKTKYCTSDEFHINMSSNVRVSQLYGNYVIIHISPEYLLVTSLSHFRFTSVRVNPCNYIYISYTSKKSSNSPSLPNFMTYDHCAHWQVTFQNTKSKMRSKSACRLICKLEVHQIPLS